MDLEKRVSNLENLVNSLAKQINRDKFYDSADKAGMRQSEGTIGKETGQNTANIDYVAMMTDVELPDKEEADE